MIHLHDFEKEIKKLPAVTGSYCNWMSPSYLSDAHFRSIPQLLTNVKLDQFKVFVEKKRGTIATE